jgi:hypothetical protein
MMVGDAVSMSVAAMVSTSVAAMLSTMVGDAVSMSMADDVMSMSMPVGDAESMQLLVMSRRSLSMQADR